MSTAHLAPVAAALSEELTRVRRTTYRKYRELLADPATANDPKAATALRNAAAALGKSPDDVQADARTLTTLAARRARIAACPSMASESAAFAAVRAYDAESLVVIRERKEGYRRLYCAYERIMRERGMVRRAIDEVNRVIRQNPELLADEQLATNAVLG